MDMIKKIATIGALSILAASLSSCASYRSGSSSYSHSSYSSGYGSYDDRLPEYINTNGKKTILVDPNVNAWGAYDTSGKLVRAGIATSGDDWCADIGKPCKTPAGTFAIKSLGNADCRSSKYPLPNGGGLMPYCMFFNGGMALHGSPDGAVIEDNVSHGCVRMRIPDAEWVRNDFASLGTRVIVKPY